VAVDHVVVKMFVENSIVATISKDATFTPGAAITGFATIGPGVQLSTSVSNAVFKGSATNAQLLDNLDSTDFLSAIANDTTTGTLGVLNDTGLSVGVDSDFQARVSGNDVTLRNQTSNGNLALSINDGGSQTEVVKITGADSTVTFNGDILNGQGNATGNIGSSSSYFNTIHAKATSAEYADVAERFESDSTYSAGTVVELGGVKEITMARDELSDQVFGVISTAAAYLMNAGAGNDETHPPVAMNGRVPVRVIGTVNKGDRLVSAGNGLARAATATELTPFNVIGRALETKSTSEEGTVLAVVTVSH